MKTPLQFLRICLSMTLMLAFFLTTTTEATAQKKKEEKVVVRSKSKSSDMDANHMQSRMAPMMDRMTSEMGEGRMQSRMAPQMNRRMSFSSDGNAFEVMAAGFNMGSNGEIMKMDMQSRELAMQIRHEDGDTSAMEAELDQLLADIFAEKQDTNQKRMDKLRSELEKMEQNLTERNSSKSDIIAKRKKELLGQPDKNDW